MAGRLDYEERKQMKKERYEELAEKARTRSKSYSETHNRIANTIPMGQPILVDHYSANRHRNDIKKMHSAIEKSIAEDEKADYYENKIASIESNSNISSDDPQAIEKIQNKIKQLELYKEKVKAREHKTYELTNINSEIRRLKQRIKHIQEIDEIDFKTLTFNDGEVVHNKEINRIQILFNSIPSVEVRNELKHWGFKWSRTEKAWQRMFNKNGIYAAKHMMKFLENPSKYIFD